jgi:hypothetical protein
MIVSYYICLKECSGVDEYIDECIDHLRNRHALLEPCSLKCNFDGCRWTFSAYKVLRHHIRLFEKGFCMYHILIWCLYAAHWKLYVHGDVLLNTKEWVAEWYAYRFTGPEWPFDRQIRTLGTLVNKAFHLIIVD